MSKSKKSGKKAVAPLTAKKDKSNSGAIKLLLKTAGFCLLSSLVYFSLQNSQLLWKPAIILWIAAASVTILAYFIINKGFSENNLTVEMLSDRMSHEEKLAFIEHAENRKKKTSWMLILFVSLITPLMIDLIMLFTVDGILSKL